MGDDAVMGKASGSGRGTRGRESRRHGPWSVLTVLCVLVIGLCAGYAARASGEVCAPEDDAAKGNAPGWQSLLLWQALDDDWLRACRWCGKKGIAGWAFLCPACGYPEWNPGGYLLRPVDTDIVTGGCTPGHKAVDFGAREGSPVYAADDGVVVEARKDRWAGNIVRVEHERGLQTLYAHLAVILTRPGCFVRAGEVVARSGSTGASTGPHLHFEVIAAGKQVDPLARLAP